MTVGFYSPLPPAPTGVAEYSARLLCELLRYGVVETSPSTCDMPLYHIGNNRLHLEVYRRAIHFPGVVVLHDAVLHHFYLGSVGREEYIAEFTYNYGAWAKQEAELLWQERSLSAQDPRYFIRPMLKRICSTARAIVVHNPAAARIAREHAPETPVAEIVHHEEPPTAVLPAKVAQFRQRIGAAPGSFVVAIFGYLRESKRLIPVLETFARLRRIRPETRLLVAGEFVSQDLERSAALLLSQPGVTRLPHLSNDDFAVATASVDCCVNLRYPAAGETSGIAMRLMAAGKAVIVTEGEEWARIPDTALLRIPAGAAEKDALFESLALLAMHRGVADGLGHQAALHIRRYHALAACGVAYWELLCRDSVSR